MGNPNATTKATPTMPIHQRQPIHYIQQNHDFLAMSTLETALQNTIILQPNHLHFHHILINTKWIKPRVDVTDDSETWMIHKNWFLSTSPKLVDLRLNECFGIDRWTLSTLQCPITSNVPDIASILCLDLCVNPRFDLSTRCTANGLLWLIAINQALSIQSFSCKIR